MHNFTPTYVYVFYSKCIKSIIFFILHNFTCTDGDASTSSHACQFHALLCKFFANFCILHPRMQLLIFSLKMRKENVKRSFNIIYRKLNITIHLVNPHEVQSIPSQEKMRIEKAIHPKMVSQFLVGLVVKPNPNGNRGS